MSSERVNFGSKLGIILATAGSAVGLGNIWRFPYLTGENGGAAFLLIYLISIFLLGIPAMAAEFAVGRYGKANAARSYLRIGGKRAWAAVGILGVLTSIIILGFYAVVAGWCLQYLFAAATGALSGSPADVNAYFQSLTTNPVEPILWALVIILLTHYIVTNGIRKGIERASKLLMPLLFILLIVLTVVACSLPGAAEGVRFFLMPDFSAINSTTFFDALGQAFFSLSLGTACLCTYASYFKDDTKLVNSALQIALLDTLIALLAGLVIFPAAFSVGISPNSGPSLVFLTLPQVFQRVMPAVPLVGVIMSIGFYFLLVLAALTSTISMHEIGTAFFREELKLSRRKAALVQTSLVSMLAVACSLSVGAVGGLKVMGLSLLDFCNELTGEVLLPVGALLTCLLVGWGIPRSIIRSQLTNCGALVSRSTDVVIFMIRYVCPVCILLVFIHQLGVI